VGENVNPIQRKRSPRHGPYKEKRGTSKSKKNQGGETVARAPGGWAPTHEPARNKREEAKKRSGKLHVNQEGTKNTGKGGWAWQTSGEGRGVKENARVRNVQKGDLEKKTTNGKRNSFFTEKTWRLPPFVPGSIGREKTPQGPGEISRKEVKRWKKVLSTKTGKGALGEGRGKEDKSSL